MMLAWAFEEFEKETKGKMYANKIATKIREVATKSTLIFLSILNASAGIRTRVNWSLREMLGSQLYCHYTTNAYNLTI